MIDLDEFIEATTIKLEKAEELTREKLFPIMEKYSFARLVGLIDPVEIEAAKLLLKKKFDSSQDRPGTGEEPGELKGNFQKLSIGGAAQSGVYRPRFMRSIYNPLWVDDTYGMHKSFRIAAKVRNVIYNLPLDYATDEVQDGLWTAARFHHYPAGGGFLVAHRDTVMPVVHEEVGLGRFYQLLIVMSEKGKDYKTGGGFVQLKDKKYFYEEWCKPGDIAIYDARTIHGVEDIDASETYKEQLFNGRVAGFVTLYKDLEGQIYVPPKPYESEQSPSS